MSYYFYKTILNGFNKKDWIYSFIILYVNWLKEQLKDGFVHQFPCFLLPVTQHSQMDHGVTKLHTHPRFLTFQFWLTRKLC